MIIATLSRICNDRDLNFRHAADRANAKAEHWLLDEAVEGLLLEGKERTSFPLPLCISVSHFSR